MKYLLLVLLLILPVGAYASSTSSWMNASSGQFSCYLWPEASSPSDNFYLGDISFNFGAQDSVGNPISGNAQFANTTSSPCTPTLPQITVNPAGFVSNLADIDVQWSYLGETFAYSLLGGGGPCPTPYCFATASVSSDGNLFLTLEFGEYSDQTTSLQLEGAPLITSVNYQVAPVYWDGYFLGDFPEANGQFTASPEPTTWALLAGGVVFFGAKKKLYDRATESSSGKPTWKY